MTRRQRITHWTMSAILLGSIAGLFVMALPASLVIKHPIERTAQP